MERKPFSVLCFIQFYNHSLFFFLFSFNFNCFNLSLNEMIFHFRTNLVNGRVTINGRSRDLKLFQRQAVYIMQDHVLQAHITVWEAMQFSVNLKIGDNLTSSEKKIRVSLI